MSLSNVQLSALSQRSVIMAVVVEIMWSTPVYLWEGDHPIVLTRDNVSRTYAPVSTLGRISVIRETSEVESTGVDLMLSGVDPNLISAVNSLTPAFPVINIGIQLFSQTTRAALDGPIIIYSGFVDNVAVKDTASECCVVLSTVNALDSLDIVRPARYTKADQSLLYPDDTAFDYVAESVEKVEDWGSPYKAEPTTPAGWDKETIAGNGTVSDDRRDFNSTVSGGIAGCQASVRWSDGKRYAEVVVGDSTDRVGLADYLTNLANELSHSGNNGHEVGFFAAGTVVGIAFDRDTGSVWKSVNGVWSGDPGAGTGALYTGLTRQMWVACTKVCTGSNNATKINLLQSEWQHGNTLPTGWPSRKFNTGDDELTDPDPGPQPGDADYENGHGDVTGPHE